MTVTLTPRIEALIRERVESGHYHSPDEVIEDALQALQDREAIQRLREILQVGRDQIRRGEAIEFTREWSDEQWQRALERAKAGETPDPLVCP